ncbi:uncharacterized protein [Leptinotarsa decemlineata]|uniref:uncharacterized protein n=1 Tax=Leptinotarsa decemlineata TaxID=7539 RepID=UPI000C2559C4|nr:testis-expressed protein 9 isoform X2 [Leptinotarsa decemlineata]
MESDLLKREDEYRRENKKLEERTKELMKKVTDVMKIQDNLITESFEIKPDCFSKQNDYKFCNKHEDTEFGDSNTNGIQNMATKGATQYYKAKIKSLQVENLKMQSENKKKSEDLKRLQKENQCLQEEKEKWFMAYNSAKNHIGKLESQVSEITSRFQSKCSEFISIKKESEQLKKDLKTSNLNLKNFEVRLLRAQEENEKLKDSIKIVKDDEKELKDSFRKQISDLTTTMKHIEKHKMELLNGFKKQLQLVDNLKKQKIYLETLRIAEASEAEYLKILDWKLE